MVLGPSPKSFTNLFEERWKAHLRSLPRKYRKSKQLVTGSRFRPLLVSWGYLLSGSDFGEIERSEVAHLAVNVELLHKATILIDDLIDDDDARRGLPAFHIEFSEYEAILFGIYLLGDSLHMVSSELRNLHGQKFYPDIIQLLSKAIRDMALGSIEEINLTPGQLALIPKVKRLIELQTISLIRNGLLVGYSYGRGDSINDAIVDSLGYDCGYLFQVLNDLEPFLGRDLNAKHKGAVNPDIVRSRKNITVAFIFEALSPQDKREFHRLRESCSPNLTPSLVKWFLRYDVLGSMLDNLARVKKNIQRSISSLEVEKQRRRDFGWFIDYVLATALERIGPAYRRRLSAIVTK